MNAVVTIRKVNRDLIIERDCFATDCPDEARVVVDDALRAVGIPMSDVKIAEYSRDGKHIFAYLRQADGLQLLAAA